METITKDQELKIVEGLKTAIKHANAGMAPSKAIAKVASDLGFNKDFTMRMVEAFNVSKTLKHYKEASGESRTETFAIADPVEVLSEMYPQSVETPAQKQASGYVPTLEKESTFFATHRPEIKLHSDTEVTTYGSKDINHLLSKAYGECDRLEKAAEEASLSMHAARGKMIDAIEKFADYFRQFRHLPFAEVESHLMQKDSSAKHILNIVYTIANAERLGEKRASVAKLSTDSRVSAVDGLYDSVKKTTANYIDLVKKASAATKSFSEFKADVDQRASSIIKASGGILDIAQSAGILSELKKKPSTPVSAAMGKVLDPALDAEYSNINAQLMLSDLIKNDPVLKRHDPHKILNAYNEVASMTPRLAESPLMMRTVLRKYMEGEGIDQFEARNLLDAESDMKKRDEPSFEAKYLAGQPIGGGDKNE